MTLTAAVEATPRKYYETMRPDYTKVPEQFRNLVCQCRGQAYTGTVNWSKDDPRWEQYPLKFDWWVCAVCFKPASLNALNSRLIRECESCEEPYLIITWPDKMNLCEGCNA